MSPRDSKNFRLKSVNDTELLFQKTSFPKKSYGYVGSSFNSPAENVLLKFELFFVKVPNCFENFFFFQNSFGKNTSRHIEGSFGNRANNFLPKAWESFSPRVQNDRNSTFFNNSFSQKWSFVHVGCSLKFLLENVRKKVTGVPHWLDKRFQQKKFSKRFFRGCKKKLFLTNLLEKSSPKIHQFTTKVRRRFRISVSKKKNFWIRRKRCWMPCWKISEKGSKFSLS